jgi:LPXTG-motif cell wall-anchored protein
MKSIWKRATVGIITSVWALTAVFNVTAAAAVNSPSYPWSKVTGGTTGDYIADSYDNIASGHVFESVTQERLLDILSSKGNYYIVFGSPRLETSQAALSVINEQAKIDGITKIYHFDPFIDGWQIDITKSDSVFKTANGTSVNQLWTRITDLLPSDEPIASYASSDTLLFSYNSEGTPKISAYYSLTDAEGFDEAAAAADIGKVFRGGDSTGSVIPSGIRSDFDFYQRVYNGSATYFNYNGGVPDAQGNRTGAAATKIFTDADEDGFVFHQVNFAELINLLNSPGEHVIFFGASWCHNTQASIGSVARRAKEYGHQIVYVYDTTLGNHLTFGTGADINKVTASSNAFNSRNNVNTENGNGNISYLYGELAKYLGNFTTENNTKQNNSITYYPNGDLTGTATATAPWLSGTDLNAVRLQLPFLISYNKDQAEPVTKQWLHKNAADDGTYTEYMLELAWVLKTPNALAAAGGVDGLTKVDFASEAVQALDNVLKPDTYGIALSQSDTYTFPEVTDDYSDQQAYSVTVDNEGGPTGELTVALSGTGSEGFTLSTTSIGNLLIDDSDSFTIAPKTGLSAGTYTATVTVSGSNNISASFDVSFTIIATNVEYPVLTGFDTFTGSGSSSTEIDADAAKFVRLLNDGQEVDPQNYTVQSGSTIITLKESYLTTLANGTYDFTAEFTDGTAALTLNIDAAPVSGENEASDVPDIPKTGENSSGALWILLGIAALLTISIYTFVRKRAVNNN